MAATLGWRYGSQGQEKYSFEAFNSSSDYQRVLLGVEGRPFKWLNMQILGGPDFRSYEKIAPVSDRHTVTYYGEAFSCRHLDTGRHVDVQVQAVPVCFLPRGEALL